MGGWFAGGGKGVGYFRNGRRTTSGLGHSAVDLTFVGSATDSGVNREI